MEKVSWSVLCLDFSCVANCYLHKGKKEECVSNLVCLIIAQPKILKSGPCRLEALYRALNDVTIPDRGSTVFTHINLIRAYHQIPVEPQDVPKTAITTPFGLYEFLQMPFGLVYTM